jgi:hypothetical protein
MVTLQVEESRDQKLASFFLSTFMLQMRALGPSAQKLHFIHLSRLAGAVRKSVDRWGLCYAKNIKAAIFINPAQDWNPYLAKLKVQSPSEE